MKKRIATDQLKVGMYVAELDRSALAAPEFRGLFIRSQAQVDKLKRYCRFVYIEVPEKYPYPNSRRPATGKWPPTRTLTGEHQRKLEFEILKLGAAPAHSAQKYQDQTTIEQEIIGIRSGYETLRALIKVLLEDVSRNKPVNMLAVEKVVTPLVDSAIRNADALVCFTQVRRRVDYTALHNARVCLLAIAFGRHVGVAREDLVTLGVGALLQDIGKIRVPSEILNKAASLSEEEYEAAKNHVKCSVEILDNSSGASQGVLDAVRYHHERCDGSGYPHGLKQNQIPYLAQICGVIDCYDALTSDRPYASAVSPHSALQKIYQWRDELFAATLVEQFIQCMGIYPIGSVVELNTGDVGVVVSVNRARRLKPRIRLVLGPDKSTYRPPKTINLAQHPNEKTKTLEIERVLDPGAYGIVPVEHLRVAVH